MGSGSARRPVPFGGSVLLTFPFTTQPVRLFNTMGQDTLIPIAIPAGFVLHDVLGSDGRFSLVARVQAPPAKDADKDAKPIQRLLEFNAYSGALQREYLLDPVPLAAVTCSAKQSLTAVYLHVKGGAPKEPNPDGSPAPEQPKELVIGTVRR